VTATHPRPDQNLEIRVLAMVPVERQGQIRRQLAPLGVVIDFISKAAELSHLALSHTSYHVALLPAALPDNGWWSLWGEMALLNPRPEILVYAQTASFQLWSGVLEIGGYDVIVEPLNDDELQQAVTRAARSFAERCSRENSNE
jgi:DNA-binding NtrC family response regulator